VPQLNPTGKMQVRKVANTNPHDNGPCDWREIFIRLSSSVIIKAPLAILGSLKMLKKNAGQIKTREVRVSGVKYLPGFESSPSDPEALSPPLFRIGLRRCQGGENSVIITHPPIWARDFGVDPEVSQLFREVFHDNNDCQAAPQELVC
jgi:hypothetical protein